MGVMVSELTLVEPFGRGRRFTGRYPDPSQLYREYKTNTWEHSNLSRLSISN